MVEQLKEVFNEMQILMLNCCEEEPLGKRFRKEDRKKKKRVSCHLKNMTLLFLAVIILGKHIMKLVIFLRF